MCDSCGAVSWLQERVPKVAVVRQRRPPISRESAADSRHRLLNNDAGARLELIVEGLPAHCTTDDVVSIFQRFDIAAVDAVSVPRRRGGLGSSPSLGGGGFPRAVNVRFRDAAALRAARGLDGRCIGDGADRLKLFPPPTSLSSAFDAAFGESSDEDASGAAEVGGRNETRTAEPAVALAPAPPAPPPSLPPPLPAPSSAAAATASQPPAVHVEGLPLRCADGEIRVMIERRLEVARESVQS